MVISVIVVVIALAVACLLLFLPVVRRSEWWEATVTPLASIMGSGFLVCAPLLERSVGDFAVFAMVGLLMLAYAVGAAVRYNIRRVEPIVDHEKGSTSHHAGGGHPAQIHPKREASELLIGMEALARLSLGAAYIISVTFYLKLLATFALKPVGSVDPMVGDIITTGILAAIGIVGWRFGLGFMEHVERVAVGLNLGMIAALITALWVYNGRLLAAGTWNLPTVQTDGDAWHTFRLLLGMLIVVQGFETSRFMASRHSGAMRVRTMRAAQLISAGVYVAFLTGVTVLFGGGSRGSSGGVAAIVDMTRTVAPALPPLILVAAIGSQFSAAVSDNAGCAGVIRTVSGGYISESMAYLVIASLAIVLTWSADVFQVVSLASRAFAAFYAIQCLIALHAAYLDQKSAYKAARIGGFAVLAAACAAVAVLGIPAG